MNLAPRKSGWIPHRTWSDLKREECNLQGSRCTNNFCECQSTQALRLQRVWKWRHQMSRSRPEVVWTQGKCQQTVETQKRAHPWLQQSRVERRGKGVILPMSVLILKMSLPKMIILFDDYNGRHYPVEVQIIQLPKKLNGELTNRLSTKISINALFWLKPGKLKRIPCIPQMLLEVKQI